jgi:hypothetical protein
MQYVHAFSKPINCINVKVINENCNKKKITNALIRPFQTTITMNCKISKKDEGNYLAPDMAVAMSQRSYPQTQPL